MKPDRSPPFLSHRPAWLPALMLLALLWAQSLGLVHRVAHGVPGAQAALHSDAAHRDDGHAEWRAPGGSFGHSPHDAQCALFDHLAIGDAASHDAAPFALPLAAPGRVEQPTPAVLAGFEPAYQARAPPALS